MTSPSRFLLPAAALLVSCDAGLVLAARGADDPARDDGRVRVYARDAVREAFRKGAVLDDGGRFMVHASRRDAPGQAEVHADDTDVFHVLEGTATFVTGGRVVGAKSLSAVEVRGTGIEGGEERRLQPGDVVIVPKGTPHWFREVSAPFLYLAVKVR